MQTIENHQLATTSGGFYYYAVPGCHAAPGARPFYGPYPQYAVPRAAWLQQYNAYNAYAAFYGAPPPPPQARRAWWW